MLTHTEIVELLAQNPDIVRGYDPEKIGPASLDVRLRRGFRVEVKPPYNATPVDLARGQSIGTIECDTDIITLSPGEFVLASTEEVFNIPDNLIATFTLVSSLVRNGMEQMEATNLWPTFEDSTLTLELKNMTRFHALTLTAGMVIGQVTFQRVTAVPPEQSYAAKGRYNGQRAAATSRV